MSKQIVILDVGYSSKKKGNLRVYNIFVDKIKARKIF